MKSSRLPAQLAKNASKLHRHVGELLISEDSPYRFYEVRQEYRVSDVNPAYKSNREKFDWVVLGVKIIIEVHGQQHYKAVCFGGMSPEKAAANFRRRQYLDEEKQRAAEEAGYAYVVVKYNEKSIDIEGLIDKVSVALQAVPEDLEKITKEKIKIPTRREYQWLTKKIQSRGFNKQLKRKLSQNVKTDKNKK